MNRRGARAAVAVGAVAMMAAGPAWAGPIRSFDLGWGEDDERRLGWFERDGDAPHGFSGSHDFTPRFFTPHYGDRGIPSFHVSPFEFPGSGGGGRTWDGPGSYDPDCDPPVATPEPSTLLLLGGLLAGVGAVTRRGKSPEGETPGRKVEEG